MKRIWTVVAASIFMLFSCQSLDSKNGDRAKEHYQKTRQSLAVQEQKRPQEFLTVSVSNRKNLLGQTVIKGRITSKATVAVFKNVVLKLSFFSKTQVLLDSQNETIYEEFHPGEGKDFKSKYFEPKGADSVSVTVTGADIVP